MTTTKGSLAADLWPRRRSMLGIGPAPERAVAVQRMAVGTLGVANHRG